MAKIDTTTLTPSEVYGVMYAAAHSRTPTFIWGPPGIAKSAIASQVATAMGVAFIDIRLSQMDPTDIRGIPFKVEENGATVGVDWSPPLMFPKDLDEQIIRAVEAIDTKISIASYNPTGSNLIHYVQNPEITVDVIGQPDLVAVVTDKTNDSFVVRVVERGKENEENAPMFAAKIRCNIRGKARALIGYEEMNSAPPSVLAACYQVILDRRIGNFVLPEGVSQFAMGNRDTDKGVTFKMPTPLSNRFDHIEMKANFECWQNWAVSAGVHPDVVGYLSAFPVNMFNFNPGTAARGFATPRSWTMLASILTALDKGGPSLTEAQLQAMIYGAVGDGIGAEFYEFRKIAQNLPRPDDVLSGRVTTLSAAVKDQDKTGLSYALTTSLLYVLKEEHEKLLADGVNEVSKDARRDQWFSRIDNYIDFALKNFKPEVNVMGVRSALQAHSLPINGMRCKSWATFVKKFKSVMIDTSD